MCGTQPCSPLKGAVISPPLASHYSPTRFNIRMFALLWFCKHSHCVLWDNFLSHWHLIPLVLITGSLIHDKKISTYVRLNSDSCTTLPTGDLPVFKHILFDPLTQSCSPVLNTSLPVVLGLPSGSLLETLFWGSQVFLFVSLSWWNIP